MAESEKRSIRVLLNGVERDIAPPSADTTLLQWLRQDQRLTGSKEGCAEGDCGACTVVIGKKNSDGRISHAAANACILLLPMIDGLSVTTVEHIAGPNGELH
ncbi:MAG: xanthine dehydrogenase small subunit, partial [Alphaproteobacteria bacterium]|nr:xanthine dehydrogenase small subunit [Alphaproteobacteria bacterium]